MPTVVKLGGRNKKRYFDFGALMIVMFTAELEGWTHNGGNREIFNKEDSRALCAALKRSLPEIEESILDFEEHDDHWICNDCYFNHFVKMHQVDTEIKGEKRNLSPLLFGKSRITVAVNLLQKERDTIWL